jgi:spermidine/putrescine transport system permease protein
MIQTVRERKSLQVSGLMFPAAFWLIIFFAVPLLWVVVISFLSKDAQGFPAQPFTLDNYATMVKDVKFNPSLSISLDGGLNIKLFDGLYLDMFWRSIWIAFVTTIITLIIAFPVALFMARLPRQWRSIMLFLVMIPFWTNFLVRTYALRFMLGANGPINVVLGGLGLAPIEVLFTPTAITIGLVYGNLPFMILPLYTSLEKFDWTMIEAANDLGANTYRAFTRVMLPLVAPGLLAGSILTFVPAVGSYITVELMGGGRTTIIGRSIAAQFSDITNWPFGSAMSLVLMVIVTIAAVLYFRAGRGERAAI